MRPLLFLLFTIFSFYLTPCCQTLDRVTMLENVYNSGDYPKALELANRLSTGSDLSQDEQKRLLFFRGKVLKLADEYELAYGDFLEILSQISDDDPFRIKVLYEAGTSMSANGNTTTADSFFQIIIENEAQFPGSPEQAMALENTGYIRLMKGEFKIAGRFIKKAVDYRQKHLPDDQEGKILNLLSRGSYLYYSGDYQAAEKTLIQCIDLIQKPDKALKKYELEARSLLGITYEALSQLEPALDQFFKIKKTIDEIGLPKKLLKGSNYNRIGAIYRKAGYFEKALSYFSKGLEELKSKTTRRAKLLEAELKAHMAITLKSQKKEFERAERLLEESLEIYLEHEEGFTEGVMAITQVYTFLGDLSYSKNDFAEATKRYKKAIADSEKRFGKGHWTSQQPLNNMANCFEELGDLEGAIGIYGELLKGYGFRPNAQEPYAQISDFEGANVVCWNKAEAFLNLFTKTQKKEDLAAAQKYFEYETELLEVMKREMYDQPALLTLFEENKVVYEKAIQTTLMADSIFPRKGYAEKSFLFSEKSRDLLLLQTLALRKIELAPNEALSLVEQTDSLRNHLRGLKSDRLRENSKSIKERNNVAIDNLNEQILRMDADYRKLLIRTESQFPDYYKARFENDYMEVSEIQKDLSDDRAVVQYFKGEEMLYISLITQTGFQVKKIPLDFDLKKRVGEMLSSILGMQNSATLSSVKHDSLALRYKEDASFLYGKLIRPIENVLSELSIKRLLIVPDDVLGYLPFDALVSDEKPFTNYGKEDYLFKKYIVGYAYSLTLWREMRDKKINSNKELLTVAPSYGGAKNGALPDLFYGNKEAESLRELWEGEILNGENATLDNFLNQAPDYRILHLSAHAFADDRLGDYCRLAFASTKDDDDFLYLRDIYPLKLNAELVTLSACQTNVGELQKGEGILSLGKGFANAGAKSIVGTLWQVNDLPTQQIMLSFYQNLKSGLNKDEALRSAKIEYLDKGKRPAPYFWAGITVTGDLRSISRGRNQILWKIFFGVSMFSLLFFLFKDKKRRTD